MVKPIWYPTEGEDFKSMGKISRPLDDFDLDKLEGHLKEEYQNKLKGLVQWSTNDDKCFFPVGTTQPTLKPGYYSIKLTPDGLFFEKLSNSVEGLLRFPDGNSEAVIDNITKFWEREELFLKYNLSYKRGILLYGPQGSGKTSTVRILCNDVIERGGIVLDFYDPSIFIEGFRKFRAIQSNTPVVVILEDIDSIINTYSESAVLNVLDGHEKVSKTVFIATTNYPERLEARIANRPSRFDKRYLIDVPNPESRKMYLEFVAKDHKFDNIEKWIDDTEGFSLAHIKELFIGTILLGDSYEETLESLKDMNETNLNSEKFGSNPPIGFGAMVGAKSIKRIKR